MDHLDLTKFKTCKCGNNIESSNVNVSIKYSLMGWFWWTMGTTAIPKQITFKCNQCNEIFEKLTEKSLIKYYIFYRKH